MERWFSQGRNAAFTTRTSNALKAAKEKGCQSIAFPLISSGIYGYPREDAMRVAMGAINEYLKDYLMDVFLVLK